MSYQHSNNKNNLIPPTIKMPGSKDSINLSEGKVRYFKMGKGSPLILVHGLGSSSINWFKNIVPLSKSHSVYAIDLPGHGKTYKSVSETPLDQAIAFMIEFMDAMKIPEATIVGNSMGGLLALAMALEHPGRVSKIVLEGSAGLRNDIAWFLRLMTLPIIGEAITSPTRTSIKNLLKRILYDTSLIEPALIESIYQSRKEPGNKTAMLSILRTGLSLKGLNSELIFIDRLSKINAPVLLLWGRNDKIVPVHHAEIAVHEFTNAQLHIFERCGHWPHIEFYKEFNRLVLRFCAENQNPKNI